jgi:hypothetical protein
VFNRLRFFLRLSVKPFTTFVTPPYQTPITQFASRSDHLAGVGLSKLPEADIIFRAIVKYKHYFPGRRCLQPRTRQWMASHRRSIRMRRQ